jgi:predicted amidohydrolase
MKIAGVQMDIAWEDPQENFRRVRPLAEEAVARGGRLVVLPEMFATGFSMAADRVSGFASETRGFLAGLAKELSTFVLAGYAEPAEPRPANVCALFDPEGSELLHFRKLHPFTMAEEDAHYLAGERVETAEVEGVRVTPLICYDLRFPEPFRAAANGTDLFCVLANWPETRRRHWSLLLKARAIENQAYVLGVNRVGTGNDLVYTGDSALLDPMGDPVAELPAGEAGLVTGDVSPETVGRVRDRFGFLADRKTELYAKLERTSGTEPGSA